MGCRLTPQFSGRALPCDARRERIMKWRARAVATTPFHGPLQLLVRRQPARLHALLLRFELLARRELIVLKDPLRSHSKVVPE